jgi:GNAT superfamily N-acetyltransferase
MHANGSLTAVLIRGSGSVYDDHGEAALLGALTLRRHAAGATRGHVNGDGGARDGSVGDGGDGGGGDGGDVGNGGDGIVESGVEVEETRERGKWEKREHEIRASPSKGHAAILTTAVEPAWQRRGLGTLLVRWVQQLATAEGLRCVLVAASPDAQAFWVRVGFVTPPPIEIPREWVQALESEFEHAHILCWLPQSPEDELQPAVRVAAAIESLISACNTASAKRQRIL